MTIYQCPRCGYSSHIKTYLRKHFLRKRKCITSINNISIEECFKEVLHEAYEKSNIDSKMTPIDSKMTPIDSKMTPDDSKMTPDDSKMTPIDSKMTPDENPIKYICKFCKQSYSKNSNLHRHLKKCSTVDLSDNTKVINYINELEKENKQIKKKLRKVVEKLIDNCCVTNINNNSNNNTINMQQNIIINSYGKENLDYLTKNYLTGLVYKPFDSVQCLLKTIHFNPKHPENHNIKISNKKEKYANVYNSGNWEFKNKKEVIENIVDNGYNIMECHFEDIKKDIEYVRRDRFSNFQDKYDTDPTIKKNIKSDVEMLILNKNDKELLLG